MTKQEQQCAICYLHVDKRVATFDAELKIMKHFFSFVAAILFTTVVGAQYYYNDIIGTQQTNANYKQLRANKIKKIKAISKDANNVVVEGFSVQQELSNDGSKMVTSTVTSEGLTSDMISYYENDRISRTEQKVNNVNTIVEYAYDAEGKLQSITSASSDTVINGSSTEEHIWVYNTKGQPEQMLKVKNGKDTTKVVLVYENGNLAAEQWRKGNTKTETYYYYFDAAKRITDIVRYNDANGKMLPDNLFEYDVDGKLVKMTQVRTGGSNYLVWKYSYNAQGLKSKEIAIDKARKVLGIMEYSYN
jgi:YD repeat-containing protein